MIPERTTHQTLPKKPLSVQWYDPRKLRGLPSKLAIYMSSDNATMEPKKGKKEPDYTWHGIGGFSPDNHLWFLDAWYGQYEQDKATAAFIALVKKWKPIMAFHEGGLIEKTIGPFVRAQMIHNRAWTVLQELPSLTDKASRLQTLHGMCSMGAVHLPINRKWAEEMINQLIKFPAGRWDDGADMAGLMARGIDQMVAPHIHVPEKPKPIIPLTEAWFSLGDKPKEPKVRYF